MLSRIKRCKRVCCCSPERALSCRFRQYTSGVSVHWW